jgi:hypothetical protein
VIKAEFSPSLTTAVPYDEVFDELDATNKIIFFSRLRAKAAPYVIKVITEIFPNLPDNTTLEISLHKKRSAYQAQQARLRFDRERIMQHAKN